MKSPTLYLVAAIAGIAAQGADLGKEPESLFNSRDLSGWEGDPSRWSVEDGAITGRSTANAPLNANTFLVWKGEPLENFELRLQFRLVADNAQKAANSGVQYRSRVLDPTAFIVAGYQADMDAAGRYVGMLYEEKGRGILARPGEKIRIPATKPGEKLQIEITGATAAATEVAAANRPGEWNELRIVAEGNRLRHFVNGVQTAEAVDLDSDNGSKRGVLALQLHTGPPMTVQFKDLRLERLP